MLLRSTVVFANGVRSCRGSILHQLPKKPFLVPNTQVHYRNTVRSFVRSSESKFSGLRIPFAFTVATGSLCVIGNQYLGKLVSPQSGHDDGVTLSSWWHSRPDWVKVYWLICGSCIVVFSGFRIAMLLESPALYTFMNRYFVCKGQPASAVESCAQLVLSAFTHISPIHLGMNMFIFYTVAQTMVPEMGKEKFLGCYIFCAVASGFASMAYQLAKGRVNGSVGASGAILGLLGLVMYRHPEYQFYIIFLPFLKIPAPAIFGSILTMDLLGVIRGWQFFDHAGHLGGLLSGLAWELLTKNQEDKPVSGSKSKHTEITRITPSPLPKETTW